MIDGFFSLLSKFRLPAVKSCYGVDVQEHLLQPRYELSSIDLKNAVFKPRHIRKIADNANTLKEVKIKYCVQIDGRLWKYLLPCTNLRWIELHSTNILDWDKQTFKIFLKTRGSTLEKLVIRIHDLDIFDSNEKNTLPELKVLEFPRCGDRAFRWISRNCPKLETLHTFSADVHFGKGFQKMVRKCENLQNLVFEKSTLNDLSQFDLKNLRNVIFDRCIDRTGHAIENLQKIHPHIHINYKPDTSLQIKLISRLDAKQFNLPILTNQKQIIYLGDNSIQSYDLTNNTTKTLSNIPIGVPWSKFTTSPSGSDLVLASVQTSDIAKKVISTDPNFVSIHGKETQMQTWTMKVFDDTLVCVIGPEVDENTKNISVSGNFTLYIINLLDYQIQILPLTGYELGVVADGTVSAFVDNNTFALLVIPTKNNPQSDSAILYIDLPSCSITRQTLVPYSITKDINALTVVTVPDGNPNLLGITTNGGIVSLWDNQTGNETASYQIPGYKIYGLELFDSETVLFFGSSNDLKGYWMGIFNTQSNQVVTAIPLTDINSQTVLSFCQLQVKSDQLATVVAMGFDNNTGNMIPYGVYLYNLNIESEKVSQTSLVPSVFTSKFISKLDTAQTNLPTQITGGFVYLTTTSVDWFETATKGIKEFAKLPDDDITWDKCLYDNDTDTIVIASNTNSKVMKLKRGQDDVFKELHPSEVGLVTYNFGLKGSRLILITGTSDRGSKNQSYTLRIIKLADEELQTYAFNDAEPILISEGLENAFPDPNTLVMAVKLNSKKIQNELWVFDLETADLKKRISVTNPTDNPNWDFLASIKSISSSQVAITNQEGGITFWDINNGNLVQVYQPAHFPMITGLEKIDNNLLALYSTNNTGKNFAIYNCYSNQIVQSLNFAEVNNDNPDLSYAKMYLDSDKLVVVTAMDRVRNGKFGFYPKGIYLYEI